jgi:hypothetical protein
MAVRIYCPIPLVAGARGVRAAMRALRARREDGGVFSARDRTVIVDECFAGEREEFLEASGVRVLRVEDLGDFGTAPHFQEGSEQQAEQAFDDWLAGRGD